MILKELLKGVTYNEKRGSADIEISGLTYDSRTVGEGYCFFAVAGTAVDGHNFIAKAVEGGAKAVICQHIPEEVAEEMIAQDPNARVLWLEESGHMGFIEESKACATALLDFIARA